jgi:hypothetical protein
VSTAGNRLRDALVKKWGQEDKRSISGLHFSALSFEVWAVWPDIQHTHMSEFVNYNKRSITLPKGCKDLADLLNRGRKGATASLPKVEVLNHWEVAGGLEQFEGTLAKFFGSTAWACTLSATLGDDVSLALNRMEGHVDACFSFIHSEEREHEIRELLTRHGLEQPQTADKGTPFPTFIPGALVWGTLRPIPSEPIKLKAVFDDLFRAMAGTSEILLQYGFFEFRQIGRAGSGGKMKAKR